MPNLSIFDQKCLILVFLGHNFKKAAVIFEISTKIPYLDIFGQELWKNYCHIWNLHPQICLFVKLHEKTKLPKIGSKNAWFGYFYAPVWKQYCHIWNHHPRIRLIAKFCGKTKMLKFETKNALLGYFWPKMPYLCIFGLQF